MNMDKIKITAIIGSPRRGDCYAVIKMLEDKLKKREKSVEMEYLFLRDLNIDFCHGCDNCFRKGEEFCPEKDKILLIRGKIEESQAVVFASPVYAHNVTALYKNFIDHFAYMFHRPAFFDKNKYAVVVSTTGGSGLDIVLDYLESVKFWGFNLVARIGVIGWKFQWVKKYRDEKEEEIDKVAEDLLKAIKERPPHQPDDALIEFFNVMKSLHLSDYGKYAPRDYEYWKEKGWFEKEYFAENLRCKGAEYDEFLDE